MYEKWMPFAVMTAIMVLKDLVKKPENRKRFRSSFLKIAEAIQLAYGDDPGFQEILASCEVPKSTTKRKEKTS